MKRLTADMMREPIGVAIFYVSAAALWWAFSYEVAVIAGLGAIYGKATIARPMP